MPHLRRVDVGHGEVEDDELGANLEGHVGHHEGVVQHAGPDDDESRVARSLKGVRKFLNKTGIQLSKVAELKFPGCALHLLKSQSGTGC